MTAGYKNQRLAFGKAIGALILLFLTGQLLWAMPPHPKLGKAGLERYSRNPRFSAMPGRNFAPGKAPAAFPANGNRRAAIILVNFSDQTLRPGFNSNFTASVFNGTNASQLSFRKYYQDMSGGLLNLSFDVYGPYTAPSNHNYYGQNTGAGGYDRYPGLLVAQAVDLATAAGADFSPYDNNGDGRVDSLIVIHSGQGEEESGNAYDIWSFSGDLTTEKVDYNDGPGPRTNHGKIIDAFTIQPEFILVNGSTNTTIGVFVHEFGHALGLPDLYDTSSATYGVGNWSLMAGGAWNGPNRDGSLPAPMMAWERARLGWMHLVAPDGTPASVAGLQSGGGKKRGEGHYGKPLPLLPLAAVSLLPLSLALLAFTRKRWPLTALASGAAILWIPIAILSSPACSISEEGSSSSFLVASSSDLNSSSQASSVSASSGIASSASGTPLSIAVTNIDNGNTAFKIPTGDPSGSEYYLAENIVRTPGTWAAGLPGEGLLVLLVHEGIISNYIDVNTVNDGLTRIHGVTVIEADGNSSLRLNVSAGQAGDLFTTTGSREFSPTGATAAYWYTPLPNTGIGSVQPAKISLSNISAPAEVISLDYRVLP